MKNKNQRTGRPKSVISPPKKKKHPITITYDDLFHNVYKPKVVYIPDEVFIDRTTVPLDVIQGKS